MSEPETRDEYVAVCYADGERIALCVVYDGVNVATNDRHGERARSLLRPLAELARQNGMEPLEGSFTDEAGTVLKLPHRFVALLPGNEDIAERASRAKARFEKALAEYNKAEAELSRSIAEILKTKIP